MTDQRQDLVPDILQDILGSITLLAFAGLLALVSFSIDKQGLLLGSLAAIVFSFFFCWNAGGNISIFAKARDQSSKKESATTTQAVE